MKLNNKVYYSKILLFGEYSVIDGSSALSIPYPSYSGYWYINKNDINRKGLYKICKHLSKIENQFPNIRFNTSEFEHHIDNGLSFTSDIPIGYGLGSSGTLCAAVFDTYCQPDQQITLEDLKLTLASIESCFHGSSSGLDPLTSYLNNPIYFGNDNSLKLVSLGRHALTNFYMLNTHLSRRTEPLVAKYKKRLIDNTFQKNMYRMSQVVNALIEKFMRNSSNKFEKLFKELSQLQFEYLGMFATPEVLKLWEYGLQSDTFYIKLCGAGGGGCYLLYAKNIEQKLHKFTNQTLLKLGLEEETTASL